MRHLGLLLAAAGFCAAGPGSPAAEPPRFTIVDLGRAADGRPYPYAISSAGRVVVGERDSTGTDRSFVWEDGAMTVLPLLPGTSRCIARAISDNGKMGGSCGPFSDLAGTIWTGAGPAAIGTLGGTLSDIMHLSRSGNAAGYSRPFADQGLWHGFAIIDGVMHDLGPMPMYDGSSASVINDSGRVAGVWTNHKGQNVPFIWDLEHGIRELPTLGGPDAEIHDINNSGQIAGYASDGRPDPGIPYLIQLPVRWEADGRITPLTTLPDLPTGHAKGINASGDTVGLLNNWTTRRSTAVLWKAGALVVLQDAIPPGSGWMLLQANDINDAGQIVGVGTLGGRERAFLLQPE